MDRRILDYFWIFYLKNYDKNIYGSYEKRNVFSMKYYCAFSIYSDHQLSKPFYVSFSLQCPCKGGPKFRLEFTPVQKGPIANRPGIFSPFRSVWVGSFVGPRDEKRGCKHHHVRWMGWRRGRREGMRRPSQLLIGKFDNITFRNTCMNPVNAKGPLKMKEVQESAGMQKPRAVGTPGARVERRSRKWRGRRHGEAAS